MTPITRGNRALSATLDNLKLRNAADGSPFFRFSGHAAVFNRHSEPLHDWRGSFIEQIHPGAFGRALAKNPDVILNIDHDDSRILARTSAGTLELDEDDMGLRAWASIPKKLSDAKDLQVRMEHGLISQMSFAFDVDSETDDGEAPDGTPLRGIRQIKNLYDVAIVSRPAYPDANDAALRMWIPEGVETRRDYSQAEREELAKKGWALPDGSFPIADREDLHNALTLYLSGHGSDRKAAHALITKRARELGAENLLPDDWANRSHEVEHKEARQEGSLSANDIRKAEGLEPTPGRDEPTATPVSAGTTVARQRRLKLMKLRAGRYVASFPITWEAN